MVPESRSNGLPILLHLADALEGRSKDGTRNPVQWTADFAASGSGKGGNGDGGIVDAAIEP